MTTSKSFSLTDEERVELERVLRQRKADGLIVRRANALLLLDDGIGAMKLRGCFIWMPRRSVIGGGISLVMACDFCFFRPIQSAKVIFPSNKNVS